MSEMINDDDVRLAKRCRNTMPTAGAAPPFDAMLASAERRYRQVRRRRLRHGSAAAIAALAVAVFLAVDRDDPVPAGDYVEIAELMSSTRWIAPSDVLLPRHEIDLYGELPAIPASTKPAQGALL